MCDIVVFICNLVLIFKSKQKILNPKRQKVCKKLSPDKNRTIFVVFYKTK